MDSYEQIKQLVLDVEDDFIKFFEHGNQAAGVRVRKAMQCIKGLAQDIRLDVLDRKK